MGGSFIMNGAHCPGPILPTTAPPAATALHQARPGLMTRQGIRHPKSGQKRIGSRTFGDIFTGNHAGSEKVRNSAIHPVRAKTPRFSSVPACAEKRRTCLFRSLRLTTTSLPEYVLNHDGKYLFRRGLSFFPFSETARCSAAGPHASGEKRTPCAGRPCRPA